MSNKMMQLENNVVALAIENIENCNAPIVAAEVSERLIQTALLIPNDSSLGLQINTTGSGDFAVFAFCTQNAHVTQEDFNWIFRNFALIDEVVPNDYFEDMWEHNRRIYTFRYMPSDLENAELKSYFSDFINALLDVRAFIRITAGSADGGSGTILISLPNEMTLRMRAILSLAFPNTVIDEVTTYGDDSSAIGQFPASYLRETMLKLLDNFLIKMHAMIPDHSSVFPEDEFSDEFSDDYEDEEEEEQLIESLDLSIRSFNCLKRAGINTIKEICALTDDELCHIRNIGRKGIEEIKQKITEKGYQCTFSPPDTSLPIDSSVQLAEMIGLKTVKEQVKRITALAKMKKDMEILGKNSVPIVLNMEFVGNPGTAKTTVARVIAGIFHEIGLLSSSDLIEVGRADLVAGYVGQTADKVKSVFKRAKGKLLFIDEAYSLIDDRKREFGDEAINTIVQEMENNRQDTIVIFAGYPDDMEAFFSRNPGLRSRVPFHINFPDYSPEEMFQIAEQEAKKRGFSIQPEAKEMVETICGAAVHHSNSGNGRFCRNLVESAILNYASRIYGNDDMTADKDFILIDKDFAALQIMPESKKESRIGFRV